MVGDPNWNYRFVFVIEYIENLTTEELQYGFILSIDEAYLYGEMTVSLAPVVYSDDIFSDNLFYKKADFVKLIRPLHSSISIQSSPRLTFSVCTLSGFATLNHPRECQNYEERPIGWHYKELQQEIQSTDFSCIICKSTNDSFVQLYHHLQLCHDRFFTKFESATQKIWLEINPYFDSSWEICHSPAFDGIPYCEVMISEEKRRYLKTILRDKYRHAILAELVLNQKRQFFNISLLH